MCHSREISSPRGMKFALQKHGENSGLYLIWAWPGTGSWHQDRQTDGWTERITIASTHLALRAVCVRITCICPCVCGQSYSCSFYPHLIKFCTVVWGPRSQMEDFLGVKIWWSLPPLPQCIFNGKILVPHNEARVPIMVVNSSKDVPQWLL